MPLLLSVVMTATPTASSVSLGKALFTAGEAGFAAVSAQPWMHRAADVATVSSVFSRFDVSLTTIPLLGPATTMLLEANLQEAGWQGRFVAGATSLGLQTLGCTLMALSLFEDDVDEGPVAGVRATTVGFRVLDSGAGGIVTVSGVTF